MRIRKAIRGLLALLTVSCFVVTGCTSDAAQQDTTEEYVAPAWMAEQRQVVEAYQSEMIDCISEMGVMPSAAPLGNVYSFGIPDENGELPPGVEDLMNQAQLECHEKIPYPSALIPPVTKDSYQQVIDVRACVIAQGYLVEEAPSWDSWKESIESGAGPAWSPYQSLGGEEGIPVAELNELINTCHQTPYGAYDLFI